ncbi:cytidine deaminase [Rhodohalobacter halophilus]|uniref:cytidine deaminase n=1 Tax=Rhodohalobacter halophilus TaxID=1812810 RepID=UPI000A0417CE|nr:cytidine deaminase [Rhodohalobacter halophilus]
MNSYAPYSEQDEYCLIQGESGVFYPGVRVENISFPLTISAIHGAICSCLANGDRPVSFYQEQPESELMNYWKDEFDLQELKTLPASPNIFNPLLPPETEILPALQKLSDNCVIPHSGFPVTALLETEDGYIPGVNIEVSAWSLGLCAERTAISRAVAAGYETRLRKLHVYAPKGEFSSPCGACRQVLAEFMPRNQIVLHHANQTTSTHFVKDMLPYGFTGSSLRKRS